MTTSVDEEGEREQDEGLGGLDLDTAKLDDMSQELGRLESEKRGLLEDIRVLRVRLADEKVTTQNNQSSRSQRKGARSMHTAESRRHSFSLCIYLSIIMFTRFTQRRRTKATCTTTSTRSSTTTTT